MAICSVHSVLECENLHFWSFSICSLPRIELKTTANGVSKRKDRKNCMDFLNVIFFICRTREEKKLCWSSPQNRVIQQITGWTNNLITIEILHFFLYNRLLSYWLPPSLPQTKTSPPPSGRKFFYIHYSLHKGLKEKDKNIYIYRTRLIGVGLVGVQCSLVRCGNYWFCVVRIFSIFILLRMRMVNIRELNRVEFAK